MAPAGTSEVPHGAGGLPGSGRRGPALPPGGNVLRLNLHLNCPPLRCPAETPGRRRSNKKRGNKRGNKKGPAAGFHRPRDLSAPPAGLEPATLRLTVECSAN